MEERMDKTEALELLLKAKELGVRSIKVHGLEAEFFTPVTQEIEDRYKASQVPDVQAKDLVKSAITLDDLTEEQILFAASEGLPEDK